MGVHGRDHVVEKIDLDMVQGRSIAGVVMWLKIHVDMV